MEFLTLFAQSSNYYNSYNSTSLTETDAAAAAGILAFLGIFIFISLLLAVGVYVFSAICLMRIFKKAGVPAWIAWVPFYNNWKLLEIGGQQGFWAVLAILPIVNIASAIFLYIACYHVGKKLGKGGEFVLWAIFLPVVWYVWLAFDNSQWNDSASSAPSLHNA